MPALGLPIGPQTPCNDYTPSLLDALKMTQHTSIRYLCDSSVMLTEHLLWDSVSYRNIPYRVAMRMK